jgi:hypothetical protein
MDDGTFHKGYFSLASCCFSKHENNLLIQAIASKFNLLVKPHGSLYSNLYFPAISNIQFKTLIQPYLVPSMLYKLGVS